MRVAWRLRHAGAGPAIALLLALSLYAPLPSAAQASKSLLRAEFWADLEPVAGVGEEWPVSPPEARRRMLAEAAWVFGGMIWGFDFDYTPFDKVRALPERFEISPIQSLSSDSPSLVSEPSPMRAIIEYSPAPYLVALMEGYASSPWEGSQGIGKADMDLGVKGRRAAYEDGLRAAVRAYLQGIEPNKPRRARGRVVFDKPPGMAIIGGYYTAQVRVRVMVTEVIPYKVY